MCTSISYIYILSSQCNRDDNSKCVRTHTVNLIDTLPTAEKLMNHPSEDSHAP
jgi:hypothetical protein